MCFIQTFIISIRNTYFHHQGGQHEQFPEELDSVKTCSSSLEVELCYVNSINKYDQLQCGSDTHVDWTWIHLNTTDDQEDHNNQQLEPWRR